MDRNNLMIVEKQTVPNFMGNAKFTIIDINMKSITEERGVANDENSENICA